MSTITTTTNPVAGVVVSVTSEDSVATTLEWEITSVPSLSSVATGKMLDPDGNDINYFTPDVSGEWGVALNEYVTISGRGPKVGAVNGTTKTLIGRSTTTILVGEELSIPIYNDSGVGGTLWLTVSGYSVVSAVISDFSDLKAESASLTSDVKTAVENIVGQPVSSAGWDVVARANELCSIYKVHADNTSAHSTSATGSSYGTDLIIDPPENAPDAIFALNNLRQKLVTHMRSSASRTEWHLSDDTAPNAIAASAKDMPSAVSLAASLADTLSNHVVTGTDAISMSSTYTSAGGSLSLNGAIGSAYMIPHRLYYYVTTPGTVGTSATVSATGLDWRGASITDSIPPNSYGTKYFSKVNSLYLKPSTTTSGSHTMRIGTYNTVHNKADSASVPAAAKYADKIITTYLNAIQTFYPAPASTTNTGVIEASHRLGFGRKVSK